MEIRDVMRICQELTLRVEEQKLMAMEDDRAHLIRQFETFKRRNEEAIRFLLAQVSDLRKRVGLSPIVETPSPTPMSATTSDTSAQKQPSPVVSKSNGIVAKLPKSCVRTIPVAIPNNTSSATARIVSSSSATTEDTPHDNKRNRDEAFNQEKRGASGVAKGGYVYTNRSRSKRLDMQAEVCSECQRYYETLKKQGVYTSQELAEHVQRCSRHRSDWVIPQTPEHIWELTIHTPEEWKEQKQQKR